MNYGQYYACRCLVQRLHPAMGRHSIVLRTCKLNSTIYMAFGRRKLQSSVSLALVWGIHRRPVNSMNKWPVTWKNVSIDDVIMGTAFSHGQTWHNTCKCKLNFTIYMPYHPCCIQKLWSMLCLPMVGACAETASSHGQTRDSTYAC